MKTRILIVTDNQEILKVMFMSLEPLGYEIASTGNAPEALCKREKMNIDLLICDMTTAHMGGMQLLANLKINLPNIDIVAISGLMEKPSPMDIINAGAIDCIVTPFTKEEFQARIYRTVRERHLARNIQSSPAKHNKIERDLAKSRQCLGSVIEHSLDAIIVTDKEGTIQYFNPMAEVVFRVKANKIIGEVFGIPLTGKQPTDIDIVRREGDKGVGEMCVSEIQWLDKDAYLVTVRDVTDRKREQEQLKKSEEKLCQAQKMEALGTLAGGIAHDFNNMLGVIIGYLDMVLEEAPEESQLHSDLEKVLSAGHRAKELVEQILTFSRQAEMKVQPLKVQLVVKEALKFLRSSIPTTITIKQEIDPKCQYVLADPTQIHQILMNLCTNAYHAMRETGGVLGVQLNPVVLTSEELIFKRELRPGSYLKLEISDSGSGISKENLDRIFDPYFTTKPKGEGTGLGLSIVHGIVKSIDGSISVYSEPGEGTTFQIYLPAIDKTEHVFEQRDAGPLPTGSERILVVDDDKHFIGVHHHMLQRLGYTVTALDSSVDTLTLFQSKPNDFDLVITDMTMPGLTGADLACRIRAIRPDIPIILCTGFSDLIHAEKAEEIGIGAYLMKPFVRKELARTIRRVLSA